MITGLFWLAVANAAVLLAARATLRRIATGRPDVDLVLFLLLRLTFIMGLVLSAGIAGILTPVGLGLPCALLLAALLARGEHRGIPWSLKIPAEIPRWIVLFGCAILLRSLLQVAFYSPIDGDATSYHLPKLGEWVRSGSVFVDVGNDARGWFPAGFELAEAWWVIFLHDDLLIEMAGLEFLFLTAASTWALARWAGASLTGAAIASLAIVSVPGLATQSVACLNDGPVAGLVLAGAALITARVPIPLVLALGAMAVGVKPTAAYAAPGLLLLLFWVRRDAPLPDRSPSTTRALLLLGLGLGCFWYARTWILMGSPVYPMGSDAIVNPSGVRLQTFGPRLSNLLGNLSALADQRLHDGRRPYHPHTEHIAAWGAAIVACGLPALLLMCRRAGPFRTLAAGLAVSTLSVLAQVVPDAWNLRFILWFTAVPAVALGLVVDAARRLTLPISICLAVTILSTTFSSLWSYPTLLHHLTYDRNRDDSFLLPIPVEARVGTFGRWDPTNYLLYGPGFRNAVVNLRADSAEGLIAEMKRAGVRMLYAFTIPPGSPEAKVLDAGVKSGKLWRVDPIVYFLPPSP